MNLIELRNLYRKTLNDFSIKESDYYLKILLKEYFNLDFTFINLNPDYILKRSQLNKLLEGLDKLKTNYPIDYLTLEMKDHKKLEFDCAVFPFFFNIFILLKIAMMIISGYI